MIALFQAFRRLVKPVNPYLQCPGVDVSAKITLEVIAGPMQGKSYCFESHDTFLFGRSKDCHAHLPADGYISRHHFLLEVNPPQAVVRDLGSLNGTYVNRTLLRGGEAAAKVAVGAPCQTQIALCGGDLITVGNTRMRVSIVLPEREPAAAPPPRAGAAPVFIKTVIEEIDEPLPAGMRATADHQPADAPGPVPLAAAGVDGPLHPAVSPAEAVDQSVESNSIGGVRALIQQAISGQTVPALPQIPGYAIERVLGQGGMGTVYYGRRHHDAFPVALKVLMPKVAVTEKARARFLREIDLLRNLRHPQICALLDLGAADRSFYFVMDYCSGGSLAEFVKSRGGKLSLQVALPLLRQSLLALEYAHTQGVVHRDLKPENILLHQHSARWEARIADFGLAKHFEQAGLSGMTVTGAFGGTFDYMPREQLTDFRSVRPTSDVWSIAATFYRVLTGAPARPAISGRDPMEVVLRDPAIPIRQVNPAIPPPLAAVLDRALAADAQGRFSTAGAMRAALDQAIQCHD